MSDLTRCRQIIAKLLIHILKGEPVPRWDIMDAAQIAGVRDETGAGIDPVRLKRRALDGKDPTRADWAAGR